MFIYLLILYISANRLMFCYQLLHPVHEPSTVTQLCCVVYQMFSKHCNVHPACHLGSLQLRYTHTKWFCSFILWLSRVVSQAALQLQRLSVQTQITSGHFRTTTPSSSSPSHQHKPHPFVFSPYSQALGSSSVIVF